MTNLNKGGKREIEREREKSMTLGKSHTLLTPRVRSFADLNI